MKKKQIPKLCRQKRPKGGDLAYVKIDGVKTHCGKWNTPEAVEKYNRTIAEWLTNGRETIAKGTVFTINELAIEFLKHAKEYYLYPSGKPTPWASEFNYALKPVTELYGSLPTNEFGPKSLKTVREKMVESDLLCLNTINKRVDMIRQVFGWGVSEEMVLETVYRALLTVDRLEAGKTKARVNKPVQSVSMADVVKTLAHCHPMLKDMVRVQVIGAMRPEEMRLMRLCDIDFSDPEVWIYTPHSHKTEKKGKYRPIPIVPECQSVLLSYIEENRDTPEAYFFTPAGAMKLLSFQKSENRKSKVQPSQQLRKANAPGREYNACYTRHGYKNAIARAAERAGVPIWKPHQLRHLKATEVSEKHGDKAAQILLGHSSAETTKIYIDNDAKKKAVYGEAREIGRLIAGLPSKKSAG